MKETTSWYSRLMAVLLIASSHLSTSSAYELDPNSTDSVLTTAKSMAKDLVSFYHGNEPGQTPGLLPEPYYWWAAGAMMGSLIDYWYYTKDDSYVALTKQALLFQVGNNDDYMPRNQTLTEGNDDQGFWGLAVMSAAENNFPNPGEKEPQWLGLAQAVFNTQAARWDNEHCGGGLRWQIFTWNKGYDYKNSISQACFFALGARLALFTGNTSYADWAEKTWDWMWAVEFINHDSYYIYDGAHIPNNCTKIVPYQFSYNAGGFILGAAAMYNLTESQKWKDRLDGLLDGAKVFFTGSEKNIMTEVACEPVDLCNLDQQSFKAYLSRWLAAAVQWAPYTTDSIMPLLRSSAIAAAKQCTGGNNGKMCGLKWNDGGKWDGTTGVGQQMAAMEVTLACMIQQREPPKTAHTGGTSKGNPSAGGSDIGRTEPDRNWRKMTAGDQAGAAILTIVVLCALVTGLVWILLDEASKESPAQQIKGFGTSTAAAVIALASGGGVAAMMAGKKAEGEEIDEKQKSAVTQMSDSVSQTSSNNRGSVIGGPMLVNNVRQTDGNQRRASNMPLGWPHNRSIRTSQILDLDAITNASARTSRSDIVQQNAQPNAQPSSAEK